MRDVIYSNSRNELRDAIKLRSFQVNPRGARRSADPKSEERKRSKTKHRKMRKMDVLFRTMHGLAIRSIRYEHGRTLSYYVNKVRTSEWLKNDDSSLASEFKRGNFILFCDREPFIRRKAATEFGCYVPFLKHAGELAFLHLVAFNVKIF